MTRNAPPCWQTKIRPSGAMAIAVGPLRPPIDVSLKPAGSVAALIDVKEKTNARKTMMRRMSRGDVQQAICHPDFF
jgi:hypothetical protein